MALKGTNNEIAALEKIIIDKEREIFRLKSIIDNFPGDIYWKDKNGVYLGINSTGSESLRRMGLIWKPSEIIGKTDYAIHTRSIAEEYRKNDLEVIQNETEIVKEESVILSNGEKKIQLSNKRPLRDEQNNIIGIVGNTIDITELKKTEEALHKIKHQLEGAKLVSASIAHELRTPLATISGSIYVVMNILNKAIIDLENHKITIPDITKLDVTDLNESVDLIKQQADECNIVIDMLLTKLKDSETQVTNFKLFSARACIDSAVENYIKENVMNKIKFIGQNDFKIFGDRIQVRHIIMNLLKNSLFYIKKANKGEILIWLEIKQKINEIHFKDTAFGIKEEILSTIFDPLVTTEKSTGTGIGLWFCKDAMQTHQGTIECLSKEGEYTEFILSFPSLVNGNEIDK